MKAIILARVSTKEQAEEGQSIPAQTARLTEYINRKQFELLKIFEITESSTKDSRKEFEKVLELIKDSHEPLALVVETVDRLQRGFRESIVLDDFRKEGKIELHFIREGLIVTKNANSADLLRWDMAVMFARSYVLQLSDNIKRSLDQKRKNGEWIGKAPIGYINVRDEDGRATIVPDPKKAHFIVKLFELYASGNFSMKQVAKKLRELGLVSQAGNTISTSQIEHTSKNPFYYGVMEIQGVQYPHRYEPLISMNLFLKCQRVRESWNKKPFQYAAKPFVFRGLITCDECGCTISPQIKKGKFIYYSCTNYRGKCKRIYVPEKELLKPVYDVLKQLQLPQDSIDYVVDNLRSTTEAERQFHTQSMNALRIEYDRIEQRISKMMDDKFDGCITQEMYDKKLKEYKSTQADSLQQMQEHSNADESYHLTAARILDICKRAVEIFESSEPNEKRQFLNFILQNCRLREKTPMFTLKPVFASILSAHNSLSLSRG